MAVADVSAAVAPGSALDAPRRRQHDLGLHAAAELPHAAGAAEHRPHLAGPGEDRLAVVVEMAVDAGRRERRGRASTARSCATRPSSPTRASGAWLEGRGPHAGGGRRRPGLAENLRLQDQVAQRLKACRHEHGALELETIEVRARFDGDAVSGLGGGASATARGSSSRTS